MIKDPKTLVDMGFNVATMASFAVPGGPAIAAGLAGAQALFDIFFQLPDRTDPGQMMATKNDLQNAVNQLKAFITENDFRSKLDTHSDAMIAVNEQVRAVWIENAKTDANGKLNPRSKRGPLSTGQFSTSQINSWKAEIAGYRQPILNVPSPMLQIYIWIEGDQTHKYQTLGLYVLSASLWTALCKLNIAFEYSMAVQDYQAAHAQWVIDDNNYHTAHTAWKLGDPKTRGPEPQEPIEPTKPEEDDSFLNGSIYAPKIATEIDRFLTYAKPLVTKLDADFTQRQTDYNTRIAAVTLKQAPDGKWYYHDATLGTDSTHEKYKAIAKGQMDAYVGSIKLSLWDDLTAKLGLTGIEADQVKTLKDTMTIWETTKKNTNPV